MNVERTQIETAALWRREFWCLRRALKKYWRTGQSSPATGLVPLGQYWVNKLGKGYHTFSGQRDNLLVYLTIALFPETPPPPWNRYGHLELLKLSVERPHDGFVSFRDRTLYAKVINRRSSDWVRETGDDRIDRAFMVEARTPADMSLIRSTEFLAVFRTLEPVASLSLDTSGVDLSIPLTDPMQLQVDYIDRRWQMLSKLTR